MNKYIIASHNENKVKEMRTKLLDLNIISLKEIGYFKDIVESGVSLKENALIKAKTIFQKYNIPCISDDTGLEVSALNGEPGVFSARYAGVNSTSIENINKLLFKLKNIKDRKANFKTIICLKNHEGEFFFEGVVDGVINYEVKGNLGFGYDPIFIPNGFDQTFGEMSLENKNTLSHRSKALEKLINYLNC
tara:strand:- start:40579 stop:41151 length:573 start_codon:yes stop_codon:yes gene_type:complete